MKKRYCRLVPTGKRLEINLLGKELSSKLLTLPRYLRGDIAELIFEYKCANELFPGSIIYGSFTGQLDIRSLHPIPRPFSGNKLELVRDIVGISGDKSERCYDRFLLTRTLQGIFSQSDRELLRLGVPFDYLGIEKDNVSKKYFIDVKFRSTEIGRARVFDLAQRRFVPLVHLYGFKLHIVMATMPTSKDLEFEVFDVIPTSQALIDAQLMINVINELRRRGYEDIYIGNCRYLSDITTIKRRRFFDIESILCIKCGECSEDEWRVVIRNEKLCYGYLKRPPKEVKFIHAIRSETQAVHLPEVEKWVTSVIRKPLN